MGALLITSPAEAAGKTTIAAGIGQRLKEDGKKVGYLRIGGGDAAGAAFMNKVLSLGELPEALQADAGSVKRAYDRVSVGKDSVIIESDWEAVQAVAAVTKARVIVVESYSDDKSPEKLAGDAFGDKLAGVVINKVPRNRLEVVSRSLGEGGIKVLGALPEDRILLSLTVGELTDGIKGQILSGGDKSQELVLNFMLGITGLDRNPGYFGRQETKAVILRSERPDLQLEALATPTSCLVLTGGGEVSPSVLGKARAERVPVIRVTTETAALIDALEAALAGGRFAQEGKLAHLAGLMRERFDFSAL